MHRIALWLRSLLADHAIVIRISNEQAATGSRDSPGSVEAVDLAQPANALQVLEVGIGVEAIARRCSATRYEQPDGVVMMQRADGDAREPGDVLHLVCSRASHDISLRPDAT